MNVKIKKLSENATLPMRATPLSAGADLYACTDSDITLNPGERILVPTGIAAAIPNGHGGFVFPRSGTASKYGITLSNCVGVIDSDYRGEIKIPVVNLGQEQFVIKSGDRIAQLVIMPIDLTEFSVCSELDETDRGEGGFGSTGKR